MVRRQRFSVPLSNEDRVEVTFVKDQGRVVGFVVNYVARVRGKESSVVRYDTAHGFPHKDVCRPDGTVEHKEPLLGTDLLSLADQAIDDLKENWASYRRRFERGRP